MQLRRILAASLGYAVVTFPLAVVWHLVVFGETYDALGYIDREQPIFAFGLLAILTQGAVMATAYALFFGERSTMKRALAFVSLFGLYHWTVHVLADAAKHEIAPLPTWFALETLYLIVQFALFACVLALVFRRAGDAAAPALSAEGV